MRAIRIGRGFDVGKDGKVRKSLKAYDVSKRLQMKSNKKVRVGKR